CGAHGCGAPEAGRCSVLAGPEFSAIGAGVPGLASGRLIRRLPPPAVVFVDGHITGDGRSGLAAYI
ncbi:MAG TPA: hypothetical protein VFC82_09195, partial [Actinomycetaceae bacterium]|nr:hypothetical protein [Actinomycetaceae bacterium]